MSSSYYKLEVSERTKLKTKGVKLLRRKGLIPGVLYYSGEKNVNIEVDKSILFHAMQSGQRIFEIEQQGKSQFTMIKQVQYHPVTDEIVHLDLMRVRRSEKMTITVPLVLIGDAKGVKEGGILSQSINQLEINCFPTDVPEQIELNVEDLELNSSMNISDIKLKNDDIEIITDGEVNIVNISKLVEEEVEDVDETSDETTDDGESEPTTEGSTE
ncbi:50S ribosomal protein L25 [Candidatus Marinimicrobia bacterium]|nr:50S ribosomal protein L25 [Candidatus Neomarinimicrobiota bacterium]MDC0630857.1 50S ribosomal protein L25 [Candidatus Neomarinimicrobiota bacterium]